MALMAAAAAVVVVVVVMVVWWWCLLKFSVAAVVVYQRFFSGLRRSRGIAKIGTLPLRSIKVNRRPGYCRNHRTRAGLVKLRCALGAEAELAWVPPRRARL